MSNGGCRKENPDKVVRQHVEFRIVQTADDAYATERVGTDPILYGADVLAGIAAAARLGAFIWKTFGVARTLADARRAVADEVGWEKCVQDYLAAKALHRSAERT
jgi:hypothetical protein